MNKMFKKIMKFLNSRNEIYKKCEHKKVEYNHSIVSRISYPFINHDKYKIIVITATKRETKCLNCRKIIKTEYIKNK